VLVRLFNGDRFTKSVARSNEEAHFELKVEQTARPEDWRLALDGHGLSVGTANVRAGHYDGGGSAVIANRKVLPEFEN
jgi:hypothetical protein